MTEWGVVTVIIALVGLIGTVAVPLSKNTKAMTKLGAKIDMLFYRIEETEKEHEAFKLKAADRHQKIFDQLDLHQNELINHENRIINLEKEKKQ